ncbi:MAG: hypothetical protein H6557_27960 [Lewinellaceae bacterium]|nr:hypothetical protein [Phaeodactylibacter sp.]MCB9040479.1 hypothetical protein [Lewinellaceae bacterium]
MMYQFPEENKFRAREVLEVDFDIRQYTQASLYVELDIARGSDYRNEMMYLLGIEEDQLMDMTPSYLKIIFSGHRGCGKSLELFRIHEYLNSPERYISTFIDMEKELEIAHFEPEDFFVSIIAQLISLAQAYNLDISFAQLDELAKDWALEEEEIEKEFASEKGITVEGEAKAGFSFWKWLSLGIGIKPFFTGSTKTSRKLREKIKKEPLKLQSRLNELIQQIREQIRVKHLGRDLLLVFDGTEKIRYDIYKNLFVNDSFLIRGLNVNMICAVPINAAYDIQTGVSADSYERVMLPMFRITKNNAPLFTEIVTRRVSQELYFEEDALLEIVHHSGGCPRQLLKIASTAMRKALGKKVELPHARAAIKLLGQELFEKLEKAHVDIIRNGNYLHADEDVRELLFSLAVLKYNGDRKVNPLLKGFIQ